MNARIESDDLTVHVIVENWKVGNRIVDWVTDEINQVLSDIDDAEEIDPLFIRIY